MKKFQTPLKRFKITQLFGVNPRMYKRFGLKGHNGLDLRTKFAPSYSGKIRCYAADDGTVTLCQNQGKSGYGKSIRIKHQDGSTTIYAHLLQFATKRGRKVNRGEVIGTTDNTGFSTAAHLHFGLLPKNPNYNNGYAGWIDPLPYLDKTWRAPKSTKIKTLVGALNMYSKRYKKRWGKKPTAGLFRIMKIYYRLRGYK